MAQPSLEEPPLELPRHKFTVDDLDKMLEAGILDKDSKVELLEGEFIVMNSMGDPHIVAFRRLVRLLVPAIGDRAWVNTGLPVRSSRYSEPEPDISIQPAPAPGKSPKLPTPHLVVEVSDSSLRNFQIEVHTDPAGDRYRTRVVHPRDATLRIAAFPDVEVRFADILDGL